MNQNRVAVHVSGAPAKRRWVQRRAQSMLLALGLEQRELSIWLCNDRDIRRLNREHRGTDRVTDVLSFAQDETLWPTHFGRGPLGDIAISLPTAVRQAKFHRVSEAHELCHLLAHGLLHLLGFDHVDDQQKRRMKACTDVLLAVVGEAPAQARLWRVPKKKKRAGSAR